MKLSEHLAISFHENEICHYYDAYDSIFDIRAYHLIPDDSNAENRLCRIRIEVYKEKVHLCFQESLKNINGINCTKGHISSYNVTCELPNGKRLAISVSINDDDFFAFSEIKFKSKADYQELSEFIIASARSFTKTAIKEVISKNKAIYYDFIESENRRYHELLANSI
jgi:hypothetical protein